MTFPQVANVGNPGSIGEAKQSCFERLLCVGLGRPNSQTTERTLCERFVVTEYIPDRPESLQFDSNGPHSKIVPSALIRIWQLVDDMTLCQTTQRSKRCPIARFGSYPASSRFARRSS